jgi:PhnB protein
MTNQITSYLSCKDTRAALNFYQSIFGGTVTISTFGEFKVPDAPADGVMHGSLDIDGKPFIMASEAMEDQNNFKGFSLSLSGKNSDELKTYFNKLSEGGLVAQPLISSAWGSEFGIVIDKFGASWMFDIG